MKTITTHKLLAIAGLFAMGTAVALATPEAELKADLNGFQQVPSIITQGKGFFQAKLYKDRIEYRIDFKNLSSNLVEAHIHFAQTGVNGKVMVVLCDPNKPCNRGPNGYIEGTIKAQDVQNVPEQFVSGGNFSQLQRAIKSGAAYVNLHTANIDGEVRGQISASY